MPHTNAHTPGAFSWLELATSDQTAAKHFYTSLFGWTVEDNPMGPNDDYTMFRLEGRSAAAAYTIREDEVDMGIPPHWNLYITVENAEANAAKAAELGGRKLFGPLDVAGHGRMTVLQDPTGAVFHTWQPKQHIGIGIQGEPGALCRADLSTPDQASAAAFYAGLFGYSLPPGADGYLHLQNDNDFIGGIQAAAHRNPHTPPHWLVYLQVEDCDASTALAQSLGANVYMGPMTMEKVGRMTVLSDPQGAVFALFQPSSFGPA